MEGVAHLIFLRTINIISSHGTSLFISRSSFITKLTLTTPSPEILSSLLCVLRFFDNTLYQFSKVVAEAEEQKRKRMVHHQLVRTKHNTFDITMQAIWHLPLNDLLQQSIMRLSSKRILGVASNLSSLQRF
jgi:hypothetical protein